MSDRSWLSVTIRLNGSTAEEVIEKMNAIYSLDDLIDEMEDEDDNSMVRFFGEMVVGTCTDIYKSLVASKSDLDVIIRQAAKYEYPGRLAMYAGSMGQHVIMNMFEGMPIPDAHDWQILRDLLPKKFAGAVDQIVYPDLREHFGLARLVG